jgi:hypothetical protein
MTYFKNAALLLVQPLRPAMLSSREACHYLEWLPKPRTRRTRPYAATHIKKSIAKPRSIRYMRWRITEGSCGSTER